jgi:alginate O-acetyltransferase complex protein AlgI
MLFNSIAFLVFFPSVVLCYFLTPQRYRWALLLVASYYFYMCWKPEYVLVLMASTFVDYVAAIRMNSSDTLTKRRAYLVLSLVSNLGTLVAFKYLEFFSDSLRGLLDLANVFYAIPAFEILLPVGISFYTFQKLSYVIEVYRGRHEPQRHLGKFAVYVAFFPQLVAGPIERSSHLLPQFDEHHRFEYVHVKNGLKLMLWGFFKKLVIADQAALYVNPVFDAPGDYGGLSLLVASYLFAFQIYCDFSGYSDIAIGSSRVLGFRLMENFRQPYLSRNINEFWQRWHISLSTWFRDYVFVPLSLNVNLRSHVYVVLLMTWALVGLWHGASWNFVLWGVYQAVLIGAFRFIQRSYRRLQASRRQNSPASSRRERSGTRPWQSHLLRMASVILTFHFVVVGLVLFRAESTADAWMILSRVVSDFAFSRSGALAVMSLAELAAVLLSIAFLNLIEVWQRDQTFVQFLGARPFFVRLVIYCTLIFGIGFLGVFDAKEFIYFQF